MAEIRGGLGEEEEAWDRETRWKEPGEPEGGAGDRGETRFRGGPRKGLREAQGGDEAGGAGPAGPAGAAPRGTWSPPTNRVDPGGGGKDIRRTGTQSHRGSTTSSVPHAPRPPPPTPELTAPGGPPGLLPVTHARPPQPPTPNLTTGPGAHPEPAQPPGPGPATRPENQANQRPPPGEPATTGPGTRQPGPAP
ncbi:basic proline-rich protein-like [Portunus trituberculatus]|uniref:basic proline-rich protein-like n=1 Tax=Portunus trituberculatus TaxID=210409 RepID=UPI001E1CFDCF|nr:basic proline-rich protein-like [Portunus trituberculatus]